MRKHKWTNKQARSASIPNFGKKYIGEPYFLRLIGKVKNKKVLELGSGNGYWLELLSRKGAICTGVEIAEKQIILARNKNTAKKIKYIKGDITNLEKCNLKVNNYDVIFLEHVLLEISSIKKLEKIFSGVYKLLRKGGMLAIADLHPFAPSSKPENIRTGKEYNYFLSGEVIKIISKRIDGKETIYRDFHWSLEDIVQSITKSGLQITEIIEPRPSKKLARKYTQLFYRLTRPMSIMIKAIKPC